MGSFANSIFNMLLGWIRAAASSLWGVLTGQGEGFMSWIGQNWLVITIVICIVCTLVDVVVHLLRWRPYRVWASFFRRLRGKEELSGEPVWDSYDLPPAEEESDPDPRPEGLTAVQVNQADEEAYRRQFARPVEEQATNRQYRKPELVERLQYQPVEEQQLVQPVGLEDYPAPAAQPLQEESQPAADEVTTDRAKQPRVTKPKNMLRKVVRQLALDDQDTPLQNYHPAKPFGDKKDMYHAPVYPPAWQQSQPEVQAETPEYSPRRRRRRNYDADEGV